MNVSSSRERGRDGQARVLLYSQRNPFANFHYRAGLYEFEDVIRSIDSVDMLAPKPGRWFEYGTRIANRLAADFQTTINPGIQRMRVEKDYDLFVVIAQFPKDLLHVKYLDGWKDHCRTSICWLNEIYVSDIRGSQHFLSLLSQFDYVILQQTGSIGPVEGLINKKCVYHPGGVDAILFCPYPKTPGRAIDVYSIGRRAPETHRALLDLAQSGRIFYVYDSIDGEQVRDAQEHRFMYASMAKRSRYFIVNRGNVDKAGEAHQIEFGNRFFEGAAAGTIMVGQTPANDQFRRVFDWDDVVIDLPFGSDNIGAVIEDLDKAPERQERIRRNNVVQSLLHHDWAYRWEFALKLAGLEPAAGLMSRKGRLADLAAACASVVTTEPCQ